VSIKILTLWEKHSSQLSGEELYLTYKEAWEQRSTIQQERSFVQFLVSKVTAEAEIQQKQFLCWQGATELLTWE